MKPTIYSLFAVVLGMAAHGQAAILAAPSSRQEQPLRLSESVEAIIADLESYVPEYMRREDIPGAAIALIQDREIEPIRRAIHLEFNYRQGG